jgi:hypothetical protein
MLMLLGLVALLCALVSLVCWVMVLIKMFSESVLQGVIGLICGLWALIWGWQHKDQGLQTIMPVWTLAIVVSMVLRVALVVLTPR